MLGLQLLPASSGSTFSTFPRVRGRIIVHVFLKNFTFAHIERYLHTVLKERWHFEGREAGIHQTCTWKREAGRSRSESSLSRLDRCSKPNFLKSPSFEETRIIVYDAARTDFAGSTNPLTMSSRLSSSQR